LKKKIHPILDFNQSQHRIPLKDEDETEKTDLTVDDVDEPLSRELLSMENSDDRSSPEKIVSPHKNTETGASHFYLFEEPNHSVNFLKDFLQAIPVHHQRAYQSQTKT
jgi:hypothetical protein